MSSDKSESLVTERPDFDYEAESGYEKMKRKTKDSPMMAFGLIGTAAVAGFGIYRFRNRGNLSASNYLMQLRVTAQGVVVGALVVGVMKSLYDHFSKKDEDSS